MSGAGPSWWRVLTGGAYLCAAWAVVLPLLWWLSLRDRWLR